MSVKEADKVPKLKATRVLRELLKSKNRFVVLQGSSRSSKTYSIIQFLILKCINEWAGLGKIITIVRKTFPALRGSVMRDFFTILQQLNLYDENNHDKTIHEYKLAGNLIEFIAIDQPQKVRGRKRNICWLNEANEFSYDDFFQLNIRTSERVFFDYNPSDEYHWIYDKILTRPDHDFIHSTYKDNPFLEESLVQEIESLKEQDENLWKIYGLGERGQARDLIFTNWSIIDEIPQDVNYRRYGVDFGYNHPSVLLEIGVKERDVYVDELIYETHLTNSEFIDKMKALGVKKDVIMRCDSAEPDRIAELVLAGFRAEPVRKAQKKKDSIDNLKRCKIHATTRSTNFIKELKNYRWKKDPKTGQNLDEPVKFMDHAIDATLYGVGDLLIDSDLFQKKELPKQPTPAELFWERVKRDQKKIRGEEEYAPL